MSTLASFRANKEKHLISLVTSLLPSPDWFLGVYNLELCDSKNNSWAENIILNLYPLDAGTDSGKKFDVSLKIITFGYLTEFITNMVKNRTFVNT